MFHNHMDEIITDTANISLQPFGDEVYTIAETGFAHKIDLETLDTLGTVNSAKTTKWHDRRTHTAHDTALIFRSTSQSLESSITPPILMCFTTKL